jgi:Ig-like domain-containing protein
MHKRLVAPIALLLVAGLACGLPSATTTPTPTNSVGAIYTAAAQTIQAELDKRGSATPEFTTTTAVQSPTVTSTPVAPTVTLAPTSTSVPCDRASFVSDVTIPDGTFIQPGNTFTKTWRLKNVGTCTWSTDYQLVFDHGDSMGGPASQNLAGSVIPGATMDVSVNLTAPATAGSYRGYWRLRNASGILFGVDAGAFWVDIKSGTAPTGTPAFFAVTSVTLAVSGTGGSFHITASITANGPGNVTYRWVRSDGAIDTATHTPVVYSAAGTQSVSTDWAVSSSGAYWMEIYIDSPNHQQFGRANFSCP